MRFIRRLINAVRRTMTFIRLYGQYLPLALKMIFYPKSSVILLHGKTRKENLPVTVLYIGRLYNDAYILDTIFSEFSIVEKKSSIIFRISKDSIGWEEKADLLLVDIGWPYHGMINRSGEYLEIPDWMNMSLILGDTWDETKTQFHKTIRRQDLRHIRIQGYAHEIVEGRQAISDFYDQMYVPFIQSKHGRSMVKDSRREVMSKGSRGALLQILQDNKVKAAGVVYEEGGALFFLWIGMPPECIDQPPKAIISAIYYFGIQYAQELGCWAVDFTGTRAFFGDGAYRYKRKWGAGISDTFTPSSVLLKPKNGCLTAANFCQQFPMLARRQHGPEWLFLLVDEPVDLAYVERIYGLYECDGISRLSFLDLSEHDTELSDADLEALNARVRTASLETFSEHYKKNPPA